MSYCYSREEDAIVIDGYNSGLSDDEISAMVSELGRYRSPGSVRHRRHALKIRRKSGPRSPAPEVQVEEEAEDAAASDILEDAAVKVDRAFCAALREHHPERETPMGLTSIPSRLVPLRSQPSPLYSSTGYMVP